MPYLNYFFAKKKGFNKCHLLSVSKELAFYYRSIKKCIKNFIKTAKNLIIYTKLIFQIDKNSNFTNSILRTFQYKSHIIYKPYTK